MKEYLDAVLALLADQPTVEEVKAEAWDEGAAEALRTLGAPVKTYTEIHAQNPYRQENK